MMQTPQFKKVYCELTEIDNGRDTHWITTAGDRFKIPAKNKKFCTVVNTVIEKLQEKYSEENTNLTLDIVFIHQEQSKLLVSLVKATEKQIINKGKGDNLTVEGLECLVNFYTEKNIKNKGSASIDIALTEFVPTIVHIRGSLAQKFNLNIQEVSFGLRVTTDA